MSTRATLRTAIVVETLPRGRWLAWPLAAPDLVQYGTPGEDPRLVMALVLPEHLKTLPGTHVARFATPPGTRLATARVELERPDLPARLRRTFALAVPWVVTPFGRDLWLHVLPPRLVLRAEPDDDLEALVASEVRRVVLATEPKPDELLELFPALGHRLEWLDVLLDERGAAREAKTAMQKQLAAEEAHGLLASVASPRHADRRLLEGPPLVARPTELGVIDKLLQKGSVLVHGPELVGKTALIEGWIRARVATPDGGARDATKPPGLLVYATSGARLMAGMSLLGQWQERLRRVLAAVHTLGAVLQIEHLGELVGEQGMGQELAAALRPWLEDGRVRLVTELRDSELDRLERQHPGLFSVLQRVRLTPLEKADTLAVLEARRAHLRQQEPERAGYAASGLGEVYALAARYQPQLAQPGSAVRLFEDVRNLVDTERDGDGAPPVADERRVMRAFSTLSGLPAWLLDDARPFEVDAMRQALGKKVIGEEAAVRAVAESLAVVKTRLAARGKPLASFLFAGPTGVGKTELARALAIELFGSEARLARFDMSEFMDAAAAERLIRGGDGMRDGLLTRRLRKEPLSVVLLDEIEKAHKSVFDLLLQALGEGRLTDASGRTASLEGAIVVLTSNLGATDKVKKIGLLGQDASDLADHYLREIRKHFAPELVNRIERIIPFASLGADSLRKVVRLQVEKVSRRRGLTHIELGVSDAALDHIAAAGTTPQYGARALRRAVDRLLVAPLAHTLAREAAGTVARVEVALAGDALAFQTAPRRKATGEQRPVARIAYLRRNARRYLRGGAIGEVRERIELLEAELMRGAPAGPGGLIWAERARLAALVAPFDQVVAELEQLEDLVHMTAGGPSDLDLAGELAWAEERVSDLETQLFELMTAVHGRLDSVLVGLTELDDGKAFERWLVPLLEAAEARRWQVRAWIEGERDKGWPGDLGLGPARSAAELYLRIIERPTDFRHLVLGVHGRHAGTLLGCETGLVAFRPEKDTHAHLQVRPLSFLRWELTPDIVRGSALLAAPPMETRGPMAHGKLARNFITAPDPRAVVAMVDTSRVHDVDAPGYFERWERVAAQQLATYDEHATRDRSELFESPLEDELMMALLEREADERSAF
ncbi:MAG: AAA family ATPase [Myxococcota bacterium]